jgi:hypothetical protein
VAQQDATDAHRRATADRRGMGLMNTRRFGTKTKVGLAALAGVTVFGGSYGLADSLGLTTDSLGAASSVIAACQSGSMNVVYTPVYSAPLPGYNVSTVTINGLQAGCYGKSYRVTLSGAAGASLGEATGTAPSSGTSVGPISITVSATSVTGVSVVFEG